METIREKVTAEVNNDIKYYSEKADRVRQIEPLLIETADRLSESFKLEQISFYGARFTFHVTDNKEGFQTVSKLLLLFPEIERFSKEMDGSGVSNPGWQWVGGITKGEHTVTFVVDHATPDENCMPVQQTHTYHTWVCQRRQP